MTDAELLERMERWLQNQGLVGAMEHHLLIVNAVLHLKRAASNRVPVALPADCGPDTEDAARYRFLRGEGCTWYTGEHVWRSLYRLDHEVDKARVAVQFKEPT